jgi:hypothetical protein
MLDVEIIPTNKQFQMSILNNRFFFLYFTDKCIHPSLIIMTPRILCVKFDTLKDRLDQLEGIPYSSLWMVVRCQRDYDDYIRRWKSKNN